MDLARARPYQSPKRKRGVMWRLALAPWMLAPGPPEAFGAPPISLDELSGRITSARKTLLPLIGRGDPIDSLYFGWFDRPYRRATLACAAKTIAVLEYEHKLRRLDNGALDDHRLRTANAWLDSFGRRANQAPRRPGFRPDQTRIGPNDLRAIPRTTNQPLAGPTLFGFIDRATATRSDDWLGDFGLLAGMGFRVVGMSLAHRTGAREQTALLRRATALGIAVVVVEGTVTDDVTNQRKRRVVEPDAGALGSGQRFTLAHGRLDDPVEITPLRLADLIQADRRAPAIALPAVIDPPRSESWPESLARRALYRGALATSATVVTGWRPPRNGAGPHDLPGQVAAAMWVHALDGQRLALLEGWRDLRDGSASPYASITRDPAVVEAVAHTALDLLYHRRTLALFDQRAEVAVVVGADAVGQDRPNRWSNDYATLFAALVARQVRFDVVPDERLATRKMDNTYAAIIRQTPESSAGAPGKFLVQVLPAGRGAPGGTSTIEAAAAVERHLADVARGAGRLTVRDQAGSSPPDVLVFRGRGAAVAVANLSAEPTEIRLGGAGGSPAAPRRDVLTGRLFAEPGGHVPLEPWRVRILLPAGS